MSVKITEKDFAAAFRAQVDAEADDLLRASSTTVGPLPGILATDGTGRVVRLRRAEPRRSRPIVVVAGLAATVVVVAGVAAVLVGRGQDDRPGPAAPTPTRTVAAITLAAGESVGTEALGTANLQVVHGCLAIGPDTLIALPTDRWVWDGAGTLTERDSGEQFRLGDSFTLGGGGASLEDTSVELPDSCASFAGDVWLAGEAVERLAYASAVTSVRAIEVDPTAVPQGPAVTGRLQVVDGCVAIDPWTLVAVTPVVWSWDAQAGELRWVPSSDSEPYRIGQDVRIAGERVPAATLRSTGVDLPEPCADFDGDVLVAGSITRSADDQHAPSAGLSLTATAPAQAPGYAQVVRPLGACHGLGGWAEEVFPAIDVLISEHPDVFAHECGTDEGTLVVAARDVDAARPLLDQVLDDLGTAQEVRDLVLLQPVERSRTDFIAIMNVEAEIVDRYGVSAGSGLIDPGENRLVVHVTSAPDAMRRELYEHFGEAVAVQIIEKVVGGLEPLIIPGQALGGAGG